MGWTDPEAGGQPRTRQSGPGSRFGDSSAAGGARRADGESGAAGDPTRAHRDRTGCCRRLFGRQYSGCRLAGSESERAESTAERRRGRSRARVQATGGFLSTGRFSAGWFCAGSFCAEPFCGDKSGADGRTRGDRSSTEGDASRNRRSHAESSESETLADGSCCHL